MGTLRICYKKNDIKIIIIGRSAIYREPSMALNNPGFDAIEYVWKEIKFIFMENLR